MYKHHQKAIDRFTEKMKENDSVLAIIIGGSIAHGFARETSDVDVMVVVTEEEYQKRISESTIQFLDKTVCDYPKGHIDGKYISLDFMKKVVQYGSEPARHSFEGAFTTYSEIDIVDKLIQEIQKYPIELKEDRIMRFYAQFKAWRWYSLDAIKHENMYLLQYSISNLILFGGRLLLAHNETLYPYHKWFLKVLDNVEQKPEGIMNSIDDLLQYKNKETIEEFCKKIDDFYQWDTAGVRWTNIFLHDSEWNWMDQKPPVAEL